MIIGNKRDEVIRNIKSASVRQEFHAKVEVNDPELCPEESSRIVEEYLKRRKSAAFRLKTLAARAVANVGGGLLNRDTEIVGLENLRGIEGGAIITSNHFSPLDNTVIRKLVKKLRKRRVNIVSQVTNFAMTGLVGFLMNYADTIPLPEDFRYISQTLTPMLGELLENDELVLIYPEKEMWFNYRKPRPGLRGAFYFAAKLGFPVIPCFVEMRDLPENDTDGFKKVKYTLHILTPMYPDPEKSIRENSTEMCARDYEQKCAAYERVYGKKLSYDFENSDIAGWIAR